MKTLGERLLGKTLKSIEASGLNYGIVFDDGSAFTIYTAIRANLNCVEGDRTVIGYDQNAVEDVFRFSDGSEIAISRDESLLIGPEFYVFRDADGQYVVAN
jgi:hypothetical protein